MIGQDATYNCWNHNLRDWRSKEQDRHKREDGAKRNHHFDFAFNFLSSQLPVKMLNLDVTLSNAYTVRQNINTKNWNTVNQSKMILQWLLVANTAKTNISKLYATLYFIGIHNSFDLLIHENLINENICKKLCESKRILSSSGDMLQWEKALPPEATLKGSLIYTSNSERIFLQESKGLLFANIN